MLHTETAYKPGSMPVAPLRPHGIALFVIRRMADILQEAEGRGEGVNRETLLQHGFSETEIDKYFDRAVALVADRQAADLRNRGFVPLTDAEIAEHIAQRDADAKAIEENAFIDKAANIVAGMVMSDNGAIVAELRRSGLDLPDLSQHYPAIIDRTIKLVAIARRKVA
jgi:hypothetical protein